MTLIEKAKLLLEMLEHPTFVEMWMDNIGEVPLKQYHEGLWIFEIPSMPTEVWSRFQIDVKFRDVVASTRKPKYKVAQQVCIGDVVKGNYFIDLSYVQLG